MRNGTREVRLAFDSFSAWCDYAADARAIAPVNASLYARSANRTEKAHHYGLTGSLQHVKRTLLGGWPEGVRRMRDTLKQVQAPVVQSVRRRSRWTDQGDTVDMTRMYAGHFDTAFRACKRVTVQQPPRIRIVCNISQSYDVKSDKLFFVGAAAAALSEALCAAGYAVEIIAGLRTTACTQNGMNQTHAVTVKPYTAPLSLVSVCAALAHPASLRRIGLCAIARASGNERTVGHFGYPAGDLAQEFVTPLPGERLVFVPSSVLSAERANAWLSKTIADLEGRAAA